MQTGKRSGPVHQYDRYTAERPLGPRRIVPQSPAPLQSGGYSTRGSCLRAARRRSRAYDPETSVNKVSQEVVASDQCEL
jgi:hypothetical protein